MEKSFGYIVDPETDKNVPIQSAIGQQVVKNYLECLKNGPNSKNILSTQMFYKPKNKKTGGRRPQKSTVSHNSRNSNNSDSNKSNKSGGNQTNKGSVRGVCGICRRNVYSTQERVKSSGLYYHEMCHKNK